MNSCCSHNGHHSQHDPLLWASSTIVAISYAAAYLLPAIGSVNPWLGTFNATIFEFFNAMAPGIVLGIFAVGALNHLPREAIEGVLGRGGTIGGLLRACGAGVLLDMCSHGILLVGTKLYERGASLGQVMAFLIASPWNSLSLTFILFGLIGIPWTLAFIGLSLIIAIISGWIFDQLVRLKVLPSNPHSNGHTKAAAEQSLWSHFTVFHPARWTLKGFWHLLTCGLRDSTSILRWIFLGLILVGLIRAFIDTHLLQSLFGPTLAGLGLTLVFATILEVCSEGSMPIAADLFQRARAPGNAFAFLMAGVSTDYTEILAIKERTKSWKIALFLPLVTLPQIVAIAVLIN